MSPQLIGAVVERIKAGRPVTEIINELVATGYTIELANEAYVAALNQLNPTPVPTPVPAMPMPMAPQADASHNYNQSTIKAPLISFGDLFSNSWQLAKDQSPILLKMGLTVLGVTAVVVGFIFSHNQGFSPDTLLDASNATTAVFLLFFVPLLSLIGSTFFALLLLRALIARHSKQTLMVHTEWVLRHLWQIILVLILTTIITAIGSALFVIPGIIAFVYFIFAIPLVLDEKGTATEAMELSAKLVKGRFFALLVRIFVVNFFVTIIGSVGLLFLALLTLVSPWLIVLNIPVIALVMYWNFCGITVLYESVRS
jgi:hypothetical protein